MVPFPPDDLEDNQAETDYAAAFGQYLHFLREQVYGESLRKFAERSGVSAGYIGKLESGQIGVPRRPTIQRIAQALNVDVDIMLSKAGYAPRSTGIDEGLEYIDLKLRRIRPDLIPVLVDIIDALAVKYPRSKRG